uniref:Putative retrotransposon protein n=1 Tax=Tanacetum cinerariifolium TaxID=118510 RepID=A0A6L2JHN0_TANCI|nr:putative retrotransposon protein [Tanacetum cinerariifolium]
MKKRIRVAFGEFRFRLSNFGPTEIDKNPSWIVLSVDDKLDYLEHPVSPAPVLAQAEIQRNLENLGAYEMPQELKTLFAQQVEHELIQTVRDFHSCKQEEGQSERCTCTSNNKHKKSQLAVRGKNQRKGKNKLAYAPKPKIPPPPKKENHTKDSICHQCCDTCHWKRNCPWYLAKLLKNKKLSQEASDSGLRESKKLKQGALSLYVGNDNAILVSRNNLVYFSVVPRDGIFKIDFSNSNTIDSSMYAVHKDTTCPRSYVLIRQCRGAWVRGFGELTNYKASLLDPESNKCENAMNVEMQSMKDNEVWVLVYLPLDGKTVGSKWLFKKKTDMDGDVHTYKARLIANGFTQTYGVDYEETFSPLADIRAIRILISTSVFYDYEIWQIDVKSAFLNGHLSEEVYMKQPKGFVNTKYSNQVCKLKRSIYGLKQASRQWNKRFDDEIKKFSFTQNRDEPCLYLKAIGTINWFVSPYKNSKRESIPIQEKLKLSKSQGASTLAELKRMQTVPYASAVGSIMYVVRYTRPDVAFSQNIPSRFQHNPGDLH